MRTFRRTLSARYQGNLRSHHTLTNNAIFQAANWSLDRRLLRVASQWTNIKALAVLGLSPDVAAYVALRTGARIVLIRMALRGMLVLAVAQTRPLCHLPNLRAWYWLSRRLGLLATYPISEPGTGCRADSASLPSAQSQSLGM